MGSADQLHRIRSLHIRIQQSGGLCRGLCTGFGRQRPDQYLHGSRSSDHCNDGCMALRPYLPEYFDQPEPTRKTMTSIFKRYADGGTSDLHIHMPQRLLPTTVSHCPLEVLVGHWEKYLVNPPPLVSSFRGLRDSLWACQCQPGHVGWSGTSVRSLVSSLQYGQARIWGATSRMTGTSQKSVAGHWPKTVKF